MVSLLAIRQCGPLTSKLWYLRADTIHVEDISGLPTVPAAKTLRLISKSDAQQMLEAAGFGSAESDPYRRFCDELAGTQAS